ncbi:glycoside hydrolase family 127 protein [Devosia sp. BSSL-BM10]|uniref:Glycoside hydrolase family 127 protein n=1 Tax=Devosia litorisediminis TaxID=2829817 RepID=A0A942EE08_9HYPH|nr:beta-L-arabinofuranosidase domain-containing protein [Devosia litorisediminis]MBS3849514.1 glycoside hydrolase family 127 protein [Devosia litorisediminis]
MSRYAPVNFPDVKLEGQFWHERLETVLTRTIPSQHKKLSEYTILDSLKLKQPPPPLRFPRHANGFTVQVFWDSDIGKWIEAASYALAHRRDEDIEAKIEAIVDDFETAQAPDGYLNCWYLGHEPDKRWTNLRDNHEMYNAGHLLEGAIAYFQVTGRRRWLDIMERYLEHIYSVFGTGPGQKRGYDGHEELELALMKLYYLTRDKKHLDFATYLINERGQQPPHFFDVEREARGDAEKQQRYVQGNYEYSQSHKPVREQDKVVGHAVRAMYLYTAMADLAAEIGDADLKRACEVLWDDVMETKMYVTAGLGPSAQNEGFTHDFDLPNQTAYAETCASVALIFWAQRMLHLDLDGKYADILELAMFNGALSGLSRDGEQYFYANPLESDGTPTRWDWHTCPCCTMNVSRLVASVGGYFLSTAQDGVAFHLYGGIDTEVEIAGTMVALREISTYPWSGDIRIEVDPKVPTTFDLKLRIPGWCEGAKVSVNGNAVDVSAAVDGYLTINRDWFEGDVVTMELPMPPVRLYAHPGVIMDAGRIALKRGPLVYCVEEADNPGGRVQRLKLPRDAQLKTEKRADLFDGVVTLKADALAIKEGDWQALYRTDPPQDEKATLTALPYYLWANRGQGSMVVWVPEVQ